MSNNPNVPLLPDAEKFDGSGYIGWQTKINALAKARGVAAYLDGTCIKPYDPSEPAEDTTGDTSTTPSTPGATTIPAPENVSLPPEPTPIYSKHPSLDEWLSRDSLAFAMVVLNIKNPVGLGVKLDGSARDAVVSL
ncbi:hypothetical protein C8R46DRAFT_869276, partial [Mycena filopes]